MREIQDDMGRIIGRLMEVGNETHLFDLLGRFVGKYVPMTNETFDNLGRRVGKGIELLGTLLKK